MSLKISDIVFLAALLTKRLAFDKPKLVSQYVQNKRILPDDTPKPGPWDNAHTPYLVEIMDTMSPYSPVQKIIVLKGCQLGLTAGMENVAIFFIGPYPSPILYVTADEELAKEWSYKRLDPAIDSMSLRNLIKPATATRKGTRSTGDKVLEKTFQGGSIKMVSSKSPSKLRSSSVRVLLLDEVDGSSKNLSTGEGNWLETAEGRTSAFDETKKIMAIGTPKPMDDSLMWEEYLLGDQRKYFVPCPHCGTMQELVLAKNDNETGLKAEYSEDKSFKQAYYSCIKCDDKIYNHHKTEMLKSGEWRATSKCTDKTLRSYQISSLYSPVGFLGWDSWYKKYLKALAGEEDGMRAFTPLYLGMPYKETGTRPKLKNLSELTGSYKRGTVPDGVLFLTMSVDVQKGSKDPKKKNPERLEVEICGHGMMFRTWSIEYLWFEGSVEDAYDGAWRDLYDWIHQTKLEFLNSNGLM